MATILAVFCHLALLHVVCARKPDHDPKVEDWWLREVFIKFDSTREPMEHYDRKVSFVRHDNHLWLDELKASSVNDKDRYVFACFKVAELCAFLDNDLYAITQYPDRAIRMSLLYREDSKRLQKYFEPTPMPYEHTFEMLKRYNITALIVSDGVADRHYKDDVADDSKLITLTVYARLDRFGYETHDRRFIISGGDRDLLFAVFNRDEFISIRRGSNNRVVFAVRPPGNFWGKYFYSMKVLLSRDDTPESFLEEMNHYTSFRPAPPEASTSLADNL